LDEKMGDTLAIVLVVDDDEFTAQLTGMILDSAGYVVEMAEGGIDALDKLAANPAIELVVSDLDMPFMDGIQLFFELREQGCKLPFMLLTGKEAAPIVLAHPQIDDVLTKDEHLPEVLPERVAQLLAARSRQP
jgi:CheY-like chemotaxis protein